MPYLRGFSGDLVDKREKAFYNAFNTDGGQLRGYVE